MSKRSDVFSLSGLALVVGVMGSSAQAASSDVVKAVPASQFVQAAAPDSDTSTPQSAEPTVVASEPRAGDDSAPPESTFEGPHESKRVLGYDRLSDNSKIPVVEYEHVYPEPVDHYASVIWSGARYYNLGGAFVFWNPVYATWAYYDVPPDGLVRMWNKYYPWAPFMWGVGMFGTGWYWGGLTADGYARFGTPGAPYSDPRGYPFEPTSVGREPRGAEVDPGDADQPSPRRPRRAPAYVDHADREDVGRGGGIGAPVRRGRPKRFPDSEPRDPSRAPLYRSSSAPKSDVPARQPVTPARGTGTGAPPARAPAESPSAPESPSRMAAPQRR